MGPRHCYEGLQAPVMTCWGGNAGRGAMGSIEPLAPGQLGNAGLPAAHCVMHLLRPVDMAKLTHMEHEYRL